jgi:hypothetical protein
VAERIDIDRKQVERVFLNYCDCSLLRHQTERKLRVKTSVKNIETKLDGNKLTLVIDLDKEFGLSSSGKSVTVASTQGNVSVPGREEIKMGINIYKTRAK